MSADEPTPHNVKDETQADFNSRPKFSDTPQAPSLVDQTAQETFALNLAAVALKLPLQMGDYLLTRQVGKGGAGIVFEATPLNDSGQPELNAEPVAVKVLRPEVTSSETAVKRFTKEARLLGEIQNQYVTRLIEFNSHHGLYYMVSEFVRGLSLRGLLEQKKRLPIPFALQVIRDLLKALDGIHSKNMVHRDVKPENLLVMFDQENLDDVDLIAFQQVKLTDFGLARHVEQSESLAMTQQHAILGTPLYMAPEQYSESRSVDATADVYAVGATLFHLLAGRPPFDAGDFMELAKLHQTEVPQRLSSIDSNVGEAISNIVAKALEKLPDARYQDASEMLIDIERVIAGQPTTIRIFPTLPPTEAGVVRHYQFEWELDAEVGQLWPLVADTNRFNQAIGLPAPKFNYQGEGKDRQLIAQANFNGMKVRWREHPFEWVRERNLSVLREFESGPFMWVTSTVELAPLIKQRCRLTHRFAVRPRGLFGRLLTPIQFGWLTKRGLDRVYQRLVQLAADQSCGYACRAPFGKSISLNGSQKSRLAERVKLLEKKTIAALAEKLNDYLTTVADPMAARIRPAELAREIDCSADQALTLCAHAVNVGMLRLGWDIICPVCRIASQHTESLEHIQAHASCEFCDLEFKVDFAQSVELVFAVHPDIRTVDTGTYCVGGPFHAPHVIAQNRLAIAERVDINTALTSGSYEVRGPQLERKWSVDVRNHAELQRAEIDLARTTETPLSLKSGPVGVCLINHSDSELLTRFEQRTDRADAVTATQVASHELFKRLFPSQIIKTSDLLQLSNFTLIAIWDCNAERTIETIGDVAMRSQWQTIQDLLTQESNRAGKVVESSFDFLIVAFEQETQAALRLQALFNRAEQFSMLSQRQVSIAIGWGELKVVHQNGQPTFFGSPVRELKATMEARRTESSCITLPTEKQRSPEWRPLCKQLNIEELDASADTLGLVTLKF